MKLNMSLVFVLLTMFISACAALGPAKDKQARADHGPKPNALTMNTQVQASQNRGVKSRRKIEVECMEAKRGWLRDPENKGEYIFGWISDCSIWKHGTSVAKVGQLGVYIPGGNPTMHKEEHLYIFKDGRWLWSWESGRQRFSYGYSEH